MFCKHLRITFSPLGYVSKLQDSLWYQEKHLGQPKSGIISTWSDVKRKIPLTKIQKPICIKCLYLIGIYQENPTPYTSGGHIIFYMYLL